MGFNYGKLEGKKVVKVPKLLDLDFDIKNRKIAYTKLKNCTVSTVFLAINHGFHGGDLWFETMIFGGPNDGEMWRYETYEQAEAGHAHAVEVAKGKVPLERYESE